MIYSASRGIKLGPFEHMATEAKRRAKYLKASLPVGAAFVMVAWIAMIIAGFEAVHGTYNLFHAHKHSGGDQVSSVSNSKPVSSTNNSKSASGHATTKSSSVPAPIVGTQTAPTTAVQTPSLGNTLSQSTNSLPIVGGMGGGDNTSQPISPSITVTTPVVNVTTQPADTPAVTLQPTVPSTTVTTPVTSPVQVPDTSGVTTPVTNTVNNTLNDATQTVTPVLNSATNAVTPVLDTTTKAVTPTLTTTTNTVNNTLSNPIGAGL